MLAITVAASGPAHANAFGVRAQSTYFLGTALAGSAAGGALSSMFWNPAAIGEFDGMNSESSYSFLFPRAEVRALPGSTLIPDYRASSGDIGDDAILSATYFSYQVSPRTVFGLSINAPFGLGTSFNEDWAGQTFSNKSKLQVFNLSPTIAYRAAPGIILGASLQIQYANAKLRSAVVPGGPNAIIKGDDLAAGFRLGVLWKPSARTSIGLGFRSYIDHKLEGSLGVPGVKAHITADLPTPEIVTLSLRQALHSRWTLLGTIAWANWSRLDKVDFVCKKDFPPLCEAPDLTVDTLELGWHDGWYFSGGLEYDYSQQLTLRSGVGYGISPIKNPQERLAQLPDANRLWTSIGASFAMSNNWCGTFCQNSSSKLDLAYTHIFIEDAMIDRTDSLGIRLLAETSAGQDIISIGLRTKFGAPQRTVKPIK